MTSAQIIQLLGVLGTLIASCTAAYHAWQGRKAINGQLAPTPPPGPGVPSSPGPSPR